MPTTQKKALAFASFSVLAWSTVAAVFKLALLRLDFIQVLFFASTASFLGLLLVIIIRGDGLKLLRQGKNDYFNSIIMAWLNPFAYYLILFKAYELLPAQEAQTLNWTWPIVLSIMSAIIFKSPLTKKQLLAIFISFLGVVTISFKGRLVDIDFSSPLGTFLALFSSIFWATYWILNLKDRRDPVIMLTTNFFFGALYTAIVTASFSEFTTPTFAAIGLTIYIGLFEMGLTFVCWLKALSLATNRVIVANLGYLAPFFSLIFIYLIIREAILPATVIGLVLIVLGIVIQSLAKPHPVP